MSQQPPYGPEVQKMLQDLFSNLRKVVLMVMTFLFAIGFFTTFYTVQPEEEAVVIRFGRFVTTTGPGLHFKFPFGIDSVTKVKTTKVHQSEFGYRQLNDGSYRDLQEESLMLTGDLNVADVQWVVQYSISDPYKFLFKTSSPERNIRDVSESIMRRVVGDRLVTEVLTTGRVEIADTAKNLMQELLNKYDMGVAIRAVKLQDVNPPDSVKPSFNEVNEAKQEQEKAINQAEEAYNKVIPEARGKADKIIQEAEAYSEEQINRSKGDASKFSQVLASYKKAPDVTRRRIYIETMEEIFANFQEITVVDPQVKGVLPVYGNQNLLEKKEK